MSLELAFLIPVFQPTRKLIEIIQDLRGQSIFPVLIVNDGSSHQSAAIFQEAAKIPGVTVLHHAINLGKGAALKTGFNYLLIEYPDLRGVVTLDADGQHLTSDAIRVGQLFLQKPRSLWLGCREFNSSHPVPLRSRLGNTLTRGVFCVMTGVPVRDTQTGLRAIPRQLMLTILKTPTSRYDFEAEMLMTATRAHIRVEQVEISTIYIDNNSASHFNPLLDSVRIYFVFVRFALISILTEVFDISFFYVTSTLGGKIWIASTIGRGIASVFNFAATRNFVFHSNSAARIDALRFILLVVVYSFISSHAISTLIGTHHYNVYTAKLLVQGTLFLGNFSVQRLLVFPNSSENGPEDSYFESPVELHSETKSPSIAPISNESTARLGYPV